MPDQISGNLAGQNTMRVVVAKAGLDGHDRGVKIVARALRDAGMEVVYTGLHQTPEQIVQAAIQEDADAIGVSILSGAHLTLFPRIMELLRERGAGDMLVFGGGIIPREDIPKLKAVGVAELFTPGTPTGAIVDWLRSALSSDSADRKAWVLAPEERSGGSTPSGQACVQAPGGP